MSNEWRSLDLPSLRNRYFILRHAESVANEQGVIVSDPLVGCHDFGLSEAGKTQLQRDVGGYRGVLGEVAIVFCSDFRRTKETAELVANRLNCRIESTPLLRERFFGDWEGTSNCNYEKVWEEDRTDEGHTRWNVESVSAVAERVAEFVRQCENQFVDANILSVSHGDPLQILQCQFEGKPSNFHRDLETLQPGELRLLRGTIK